MNQGLMSEVKFSSFKSPLFPPGRESVARQDDSSVSRECMCKGNISCSSSFPTMTAEARAYRKDCKVLLAKYPQTKSYHLIF